MYDCYKMMTLQTYDALMISFVADLWHSSAALFCIGFILSCQTVYTFWSLCDLWTSWPSAFLTSERPCKQSTSCEAEAQTDGRDGVPSSAVYVFKWKPQTEQRLYGFRRVNISFLMRIFPSSCSDCLCVFIFEGTTYTLIHFFLT